MNDETRRAFFDHVGKSLSAADSADLHPGLVVTIPLTLHTGRGDQQYRADDVLFHRTVSGCPCGLDVQDSKELAIDALEDEVRRMRRSLRHERRMLAQRARDAEADVVKPDRAPEVVLVPEAEHDTEFGRVWVSVLYVADDPKGAQVIFDASVEPLADRDIQHAVQGYRLRFSPGPQPARFRNLPAETPDYVARHLAWTLHKRRPGEYLPPLDVECESRIMAALTALPAP